MDKYRTWASYPRLRDDPYITFAPLPGYYPSAERWFREHLLLGGAETLSMQLQAIELSMRNNRKHNQQQQSGVDDKEELNDIQEKQRQLVEQTLSLLTSVGVIGALLISVSLPLVLTPLTPSDAAQQFFGTTGVDVVTYLYRILIIGTAVESLLTVLACLKAYMQLSVWMPTLELKMWWCTHISVTSVVWGSNVILMLAFASLPFGVAVNVSPGIGLVTLIAGVYFVVRVLHLGRADYLGIVKLHQWAAQLFNIQPNN